MDQGSFGAFAQWTYDIGLVFNVRFTKNEQADPLSWRLFDQKIMQGVDFLPGGIQLPPRPARIAASLNTTLWTFGKCSGRATKGQPGRRTLQFVPATSLYVGDWTLDNLLTEYAVSNPISGPDDNPVPRQLIVIGVL